MTESLENQTNTVSEQSTNKKVKVDVARTYEPVVPFTNTWLFPESVVKNNWYIAVYLGDKIPYVVKFNGRCWVDRNDKIVAVPMRIKSVGDLPKEKKEKEEL